MGVQRLIALGVNTELLTNLVTFHRLTLQRKSATFVAAAMLLVGCVTVFSNAVAGPFQDGQAAFDKGDYSTALKFWLPLANEGDAKAQSKLSGMYTFGWGVPKNDTEALKWLRKAADQGEPGDQFILGLSYRFGEGVPKNVTEGLAWIRKAAQQGYVEAQYELGGIYLAVMRCRRTLPRRGNGTRWPPT